MSKRSFKSLAREFSGGNSLSGSLLLLVIVTLISALLAWGAVTELDSVVRGGGKLVSESQNQLVQSADTGVIRARLIDEGQVVTKDQPLFEIDPVEAKSELERSLSQLSALRAKEIRLRSEVEGATPSFPPELQTEAPEVISNELALFQARLKQLEGEIATLESRLAQRNTEIQETKISVETSERAIDLIEEEIATVEPLVSNGLAPETRLISLRRDREENQGRVNSGEAAQVRLLAALSEVEGEIASTRDRYLTESLTELASTAAEITQIESILPALEERVNRTTVRSPVDGVVNRINYRTSGAFVRPGDVLLEIVPTGDDLIVEARIDPKDIASVVVGDTVKTSLTAYDPTRYGRIDGEVLSISPDAMTDPESGEQYYLLDISLSSDLYHEDGKPVERLPGMVASVDVNAGKRTILEYFWQPIARIKDTAFRE